MVNAKEDNQNKNLVTVMLDEYESWYTQFMRSLLYPKASGKKGGAAFPSLLKEDDCLNSSLLVLCPLQEELYQHAKKLESFIESDSEKTDVALFDNFSLFYESFISRLRRLKRDGLRVDSAIDPVTGLRTQAVLLSELNREMERLFRDGAPFCVVFVRIDLFSKLHDALDSESYTKTLRKIAAALSSTLRSFDDAYFLGEGEFILSLKQTDAKGGGIAVSRARALISEEALVFVEKGQNYPITLSYCVAEPVTGDLIEDVLSNMRADLDRYEDDSDAALEYIEQSPLQRYMKKEDEN